MCKSCRSRRVCGRDTGTRNEVRVVTGLDHETASRSCVTPIHIRQNSSEVLHVSSSSIGLALPPMCTSPKTSRELLEIEKLSGTRFCLQLIRCLMLRPWQPGLPTGCVLFVSSERDCRHALSQEHVIPALFPSSVSTPQDRRFKDPTPSPLGCWLLSTAVDDVCALATTDRHVTVKMWRCADVFAAAHLHWCNQNLQEPR